jgi:hypothetical protein
VLARRLHADRSAVTEGHESVRVIEGSGRKIVLQHLLVVKGDTGKPLVIKHWGQDRIYEP